MNQAAALRLAGVFGGLAVVLGAFGAHGLEGRLSAEMMDIYRTAVTYHAWHALALLAVGAGVADTWRSRWTAAACWAWAAGIVVFSGTLYLLAVTEMRWLGAITPIGGASMIAGWACIAIAAGKVHGGADGGK